MQISATVQLEAGDSFAFTAEEAAAKVLAALGGDPDGDHCAVTVSARPEMGSAGSVPQSELPPARMN